MFQAHRRWLAIAAIILACTAATIWLVDRPSADAAPAPVLILRGDPTTTMTVQWFRTHAAGDEAAVWLAEVGSDAWTRIVGVREPFKDAPVDLYRVDLTGLTPGAAYQFKLAPGGPSHKFRTIDSDPQTPLTFVEGGDAGSTGDAGETCTQAAARSPAFALIGGDMVYAKNDSYEYWTRFARMWHARMVTPAGFLVPIVACVGNHDVEHHDHPDQPHRQQASRYLSLFGYAGGRTYGVIDFGPDTSLILLDTAHVEPIEGEQTRWLEQTLSERADRQHLLVAYHTPAYPSVQAWDYPPSVAVRRHWAPLFEKFGVDLAFEHNDHTYKRTVPIAGEHPDPRGIVYVGDGGWGAELREPRPAWYLARTASVHHFIHVTLQHDVLSLVAIDSRGHVIDMLPDPEQHASSHTAKPPPF
jgi:hypothetical protein